MFQSPDIMKAPNQKMRGLLATQKPLVGTPILMTDGRSTNLFNVAIQDRLYSCYVSNWVSLGKPIGL